MPDDQHPNSRVAGKEEFLGARAAVPGAGCCERTDSDFGVLMRGGATRPNAAAQARRVGDGSGQQRLVPSAKNLLGSAIRGEVARRGSMGQIAMLR